MFARLDTLATLGQDETGTLARPPNAQIIKADTLKPETPNIEQSKSLYLETKWKQELMTGNLEQRVIRHHKPHNNHYTTAVARLNTFRDWPETKGLPDPSSLAEAGLYYLGQKDETKCFHCGGKLHSWQKGDEGWKEHARWYPNCEFVRINKGVQFALKWSHNPSLPITGTVSELDCKPTTSEQAPNGINTNISDPGVTIANPEAAPTHNECKICMINPKEIIFLPCAHLTTCQECGISLEECVICRQYITHIARVFIP